MWVGGGGGGVSQSPRRKLGATVVLGETCRWQQTGQQVLEPDRKYKAKDGFAQNLMKYMITVELF